MNDINQISQVALNIEKLGIVGILAVLAVVFIYLYIKQAKENAEVLKDILNGVRETLDNQKDFQKKLNEKQSQLIDMMLNRESRIRKGDRGDEWN